MQESLSKILTSYPCSLPIQDSSYFYETASAYASLSTKFKTLSAAPLINDRVPNKCTQLAICITKNDALFLNKPLRGNKRPSIVYS